MDLVPNRLIARIVVRKKGNGTGAVWLSLSRVSRMVASVIASHSRQFWIAFKSLDPWMAGDAVLCKSTRRSTAPTSTFRRGRASSLCSRKASSTASMAESTSKRRRRSTHGGSVKRPFWVGCMSTRKLARSKSKSTRLMSSAHSGEEMVFEGSVASRISGSTWAVCSTPWTLRHSRTQFSAAALGNDGSEATTQRSTIS
eukprot:scaffold1166_cov261-Pinguiococcus_pyrenoidosus.AAC.57